MTASGVLGPYCQILATVPAHQGHIGSSLLRDVFDRVDREQMSAYLEATSPRRMALYERHGYISQELPRCPMAAHRCGRCGESLS